MKVERIERDPRGLTSEVRDKIIGAMMAGELVPGDRLILDTLADQLGVSRTPVRDALLRLVSEGIVELADKRGYVFRQLSDAEIEHNLESRNTLLAHFDWLALGLVLAVVSVALEGRERLPQPLDWLARHPGQCLLLALGVYLGMVAALPPVPFRFVEDTSTYVALHVLHIVLAALILVPVAFGNPNQGVSRRFLGHPVLIWFGLISYGLYLWHFSVVYELIFNDPTASFGTVLLLTLVISVPLAAFSWYAIEKPLMRFKYGRSWRRDSPAARDEQRL